MAREVDRPMGCSVCVTELPSRLGATLDRVARSRQAIVITKRGRPVALLAPIEDGILDLRASVLAEADIVAPSGVRWDAES